MLDHILMADPSQLACADPQIAAQAAETAIVVRCHFIDDHLLRNARRLSASKDYDLVFAIDASQGALQVGDYKTIPVTRSACADLGLFVEEDSLLWKCGDYSLYLARQSLADYKQIWLVDYDVVINWADPLDFFRAIDAQANQDFIATYIWPADENWSWRRAMEGVYEDVYRCFFPLLRISGAAVDFLLQQRIAASNHAVANRVAAEDWPNDEAFTITSLVYNGFSCADLNDFGSFYSNDKFGHGTLSHPSQLPPNDRMLYHPVRDGAGYTQAVYKGYAVDPKVLVAGIGWQWSDAEVEHPLLMVLGRALYDLGDNPDRMLADGSLLQGLVSASSTPGVLAAITRALAAARMPDCLDQLREQCLDQGRMMPRLLTNIALAKPAAQSSVCEYSHIRIPRRDAEGGNNGLIEGDYGFHTRTEADPWWQVDLKAVYNVSEIIIHNRRTSGDRLRGFEIKFSYNGRDWRTVYQSDPADVPALTLPVKLAGTPRGRFIRVEIPRRATLHFVELEAFGSPPAIMA